jgi:hypothetical protein
MKTAISILLVLGLLSGLAVAQAPQDGLTLISPRNSNETFLIDVNFNVVQTWTGANRPSQTAYVLPDNSLLRPTVDTDATWGPASGGGRIQKIDANDNIVWDFFVSDSLYLQHHDIEPMPGGNVLVIAWERKTEAEARAAGRQNVPFGEVWPTVLVEFEQDGLHGARVVWEWHLWDHLIQDADPTKDNYGVLADHPELVDINYPAARQGSFDHANAVTYNPELDQIVFSARAISEVYVIDHSTTTGEAAGHTGGNSGKGGDILYRWGNPMVYDRGTAADRVFHSVHGAVWIDCGLPGAGNLLVFNNGNRPGSANDYSSVVEIELPVDANGHYHIAPGLPFEPATPVWTYEDPGNFYSQSKGGAFRMPNGNTLITESNANHVFEVTRDGQKVWAYNPPGEVHRAKRYTAPTAPVAWLDIKPGSCPNPFNTKWFQNLDASNGKDVGNNKKGGVLPVALAGTLCFDVHQVDVTTLRLEGVTPLRSGLEDVTGPAGENDCGCNGDGPDGFVDLTLKFSRREIAAAMGPVLHGEVVTLTLTGELLDGTRFSASDCVTIRGKLDEPEPYLAPGPIVLGPATPNPFNPVTRIAYSLPVETRVRLVVYNVSGERVATLVDDVVAAGDHTAVWDARGAASGLYFYRFTAGTFGETRKLILLK